MKAEVYSRDNCVWCDRAKVLLDQKGIEYTESKLEKDYTLDEFKNLFPGARTVPQIKIDGVSVGGYDNLVEYLKTNGV